MFRGNHNQSNGQVRRVAYVSNTGSTASSSGRATTLSERFASVATMSRGGSAGRGTSSNRGGFGNQRGSHQGQRSTQQFGNSGRGGLARARGGGITKRGGSQGHAVGGPVRHTRGGQRRVGGFSSRGARGRGGRGSFRGRGGRPRKLDKESLDAQLEAYMMKDPKYAEAKLNEELEDYMATEDVEMADGDEGVATGEMAVEEEQL